MLLYEALDFGFDVHGDDTYLRIPTLNTVKVQIGISFSRSIARCGTTAEAYQHGRPPQDNHAGAFADKALILQGIGWTDGAESPREHNRFVISAPLKRRLITARPLCGSWGQKSSEAAGQAGSSKLVVEARAANWSLQHDVETAGKVSRASDVDFPWGTVVGYEEVGDPKGRKSCFGD